MPRVAQDKAEPLSQWEAKVDGALVRLRAIDGTTLGTGFFVSRRGLVLTCHHVIAGAKVIIVETATGKQFKSTIKADDLFPNSDLALVRTNCTLKAPLAIAAADVSHGALVTKGYEFEGLGLNGAVPVKVEMVGRTQISYEHGARCYKMNVLALNRGDLAAGISGSPLVDPVSGVALGVVVAHLPGGRTLQGFAVTLATAVTRDRELAVVVDENSRTCARFGKYLNALGAKELCKRQVKGAVDRLVADGLYLPDRFVSRNALRNHLNRFLRTDCTVLPIIGYAGVGKTTWLANLSLSSREHVLLIRALHIERGTMGLPELIRQSLEREAKGEGQDTGADLLADVLKKAGHPLTVLLDGLNEARAAHAEISKLWIHDSLRWLDEHRVRLVLTCRPEHWERYSAEFPSKCRYSTRRNEAIESDVRLEGFNENETKEAKRIYGISGFRFERAEHPLLLRLYAEDPTSHTERHRLRFGAVVDRWVDRVCREVANQSPNQISVKEIKRLVNDLASECYRRRRPELDARELHTRFQGCIAEIRLLVSEHLLIELDDGYRFTFDDVREYLESAHVTAAVVSEPSLFLADAPEIPQNVIIHFLSRQQQRQEMEQLSISLRSLTRYLSLPEVESPVTHRVWSQAFRHFHFAFRLAGVLDITPALVPDIRDLLVAAVKLDPHTALYSFCEDAREMYGLPSPTALSIIRALLPGERWRGWRRKDWHPTSHGYSHTWDEKFHDQHSVAPLLKRILDNAQKATLEALIDWMSDETPLYDGWSGSREATIGDFAVACLFRWRHADFCWISHNIRRGDRDRGKNFLEAVAITDATLLMPIVQEWAIVPQEQSFAVVLAGVVRHNQTSASLQSDASGVLRSIVASVKDPTVRIAAAARLGPEGATDESIWAIVRDSFLQGTPYFDMGAFSQFLASRLNEVIELIRFRPNMAKSSDWNFGYAWSAVHFVSRNTNNDPARVAAAVTVLRDAYDRWGAPATIIASVLEDMAYGLSRVVALEAGYLDFSKEFIDRAPADALQYLRVAAYPRPGLDEDIAVGSDLRNFLEQRAPAKRGK